MVQSELEKIQECINILRQTIEKYTNSTKVLIGWAVIQDQLDENNVAMGSKSGEVNQEELIRLVFEINGSFYRLYDQGEYED